MERLDLIKKEINLVKSQTDKLISDIDADQWMVNPEVLNSNLNWQIGHIILANYLHGIASIKGPSKEIRERINVQDYIKFYGMKSDPSQHKEEKPSPETLLEIYTFSFELINKNLESLELSDLEQATAVPNPGAKTKSEALMWLFKHQSWHNGQIAMLKRVLKDIRIHQTV